MDRRRWGNIEHPANQGTERSGTVNFPRWASTKKFRLRLRLRQPSRHPSLSSPVDFPTHTAIMADAAPRRGGFGSRGDRGGDRGRGRGRRGRRGGAKSEEKEWQPVTKLGRLVKAGKITSMEQIYLHSLPVKEYQIVDFFLPKLKDEVMKIKPVQKQTRAGQRTRFKAIVIIGDGEGHVGLGIKTSKEVATAIRAAIIIAKLSVLPIRRGYWGTNLGEPHSLPTKESGKCGSVTVRLIPAPRGTGLVASPAVKRLLQLAGVQDAYTSSSGSTKTLENTLKATFLAVGNTYGFLTPNLWKETKLIRSPLEEFGDVLREGKRY
ncbi:40S ribosomal protein S2 [Talaromyces pinophilus]|nr:40S ribosomal protein S2 [Talaromyces pinophilus]